jgi:hypothetical protein
MRATSMPVKGESMLPQAPTLTLSPDLGSGMSLGHCQTQLRQGSRNFDASERLGEQICGHARGGDVAHGDDARVHHVAQPEEAQVQVLHAPMVLRVARNLDHQLVFHEQEGGHVERIAKLAEERAHRDDLLAGGDDGDELGLCRGERNDGLEAQHPGDSTSAHLHDVGARRAAIVRVAAVQACQGVSLNSGGL